MRITYSRSVLPVPFRPSARAAWRWVELREWNRAIRSCASRTVGAACVDDYRSGHWCATWGAPKPSYLPGGDVWENQCAAYRREATQRCFVA